MIIRLSIYSSSTTYWLKACTEKTARELQRQMAQRCVVSFKNRKTALKQHNSNAFLSLYQGHIHGGGPQFLENNLKSAFTLSNVNRRNSYCHCLMNYWFQIVHDT